MTSVALLQNRLRQIATALEQTGEVQALLGLGSAGLDSDRMDEYSDLDFFVIVMPGYKQKYIQDLFWLEQCGPIAFHYQNTVDGNKVLYADGVFCEFAVFEPQELAGIPFARGRLIWHSEGFDPAMCEPVSTQGRYQRSPDRDWHINEVLTNLYIGVCRFLRGEKLAAMKLIQQSAVAHILDLMLLDQPASAAVDPYAPERRIETHLPQLESLLPDFCPGYAHSLQAAESLLAWLETNACPSIAMTQEIRRLIGNA